MEQLALQVKSAFQSLATNLANLTKQNGLKLEGQDLNALTLQILAQTLANTDKLEGYSYADLQAMVGGAESSVADIQAQLDAHIARTDNPHQVTAEQAGLGNVTNQGFATAEEADLAVTNKYIDPALVKVAVDRAIAALSEGAPETIDTLQEIAAIFNNDPQVVNNLITAVAGLISVADSQALMDSTLVTVNTRTDSAFSTVFTQAKLHSDSNIGSLADWLSELAASFSPLKVLYELVMSIGGPNNMGNRGYSTSKGASLGTGGAIGSISRTVLTGSANIAAIVNRYEDNQIRMEFYPMSAGAGIGVVDSVEIGGVSYKFASRGGNPYSDSYSMHFTGEAGKFPPNGDNVPVKFMMKAPVLKLIHDTNITVGRAAGIQPSGWSYGYRVYGNYQYGSIVDNTIEDALNIQIVSWHDYNRLFQFVLLGDRRTSFRLDKVMLGTTELDMSAAVPTYNSSQNLTGWAVALPAEFVIGALLGQSVPLKVYGERL